jgi:hypothetical protein
LAPEKAFSQQEMVMAEPTTGAPQEKTEDNKSSPGLPEEDLNKVVGGMKLPVRKRKIGGKTVITTSGPIEKVPL